MKCVCVLQFNYGFVWIQGILVKWGSGKSKFPLPVFGWAEKCKGFSLQLFPFSVGRTSEEIHTSFSHGPLGNDKTVGLSLSFLSFTLFFSRLLFPSLSDLGENSRSLSLSLSKVKSHVAFFSNMGWPALLFSLWWLSRYILLMEKNV